MSLNKYVLVTIVYCVTFLWDTFSTVLTSFNYGVHHIAAIFQTKDTGYQNVIQSIPQCLTKGIEY